MSKATLHLCGNEREFSALKGDGQEFVKLTLNFDNPNYFLNGVYLVLKDSDGRNSFVRPSSKNHPFVDKISCDTQHLQFDRNAGLLPNSFEYKYSPVGPQNEEYDALAGKLKAVGEWNEHSSNHGYDSRRLRVSEQRRLPPKYRSD